LESHQKSPVKTKARFDFDSFDRIFDNNKVFKDLKGYIEPR